MQIELIGCTSAGKSTLARDICQVCHEQGLDILAGNDFILKQIKLNWIKNRLSRTFLVNLAALLACLVTWQNNLKFYLFATQLLFQLPIPRLEKLYLLRNVLKKIGIYEIIRFRSTGQQVILVDEGVVQTVHNFFVHVSVQVEAEQLATFARLIPLPDVIVYLRQPEALLIDRTIKRGHKRIPDRSYSNVARFIKQAVAIFEQLVQNPAVQNKVLVVAGDQDVIIAPNYQDAPLFGLALKIIQNGLTIGNYESFQANTSLDVDRKLSIPLS